MDRATLSFLTEIKRVTLLAKTSLDFRVILVPTLVTDNAVFARSMGGSQNYLYLIRMDEAEFLGPVLAISFPDLVDCNCTSSRTGAVSSFMIISA